MSATDEAAGAAFVKFSPLESQPASEFTQKVGEVDKPRQEVVAAVRSDPELASPEENNSSFKVDFNKAFNPGFNKFGDFGGQSAASVLWGEQKD